MKCIIVLAIFLLFTLRFRDLGVATRRLGARDPQLTLTSIRCTGPQSSASIGQYIM